MESLPLFSECMLQLFEVFVIHVSSHLLEINFLICATLKLAPQLLVKPSHKTATMASDPLQTHFNLCHSIILSGRVVLVPYDTNVSLFR